MLYIYRHGLFNRDNSLKLTYVYSLSSGARSSIKFFQLIRNTLECTFMGLDLSFEEATYYPYTSGAL